MIRIMVADRPNSSYRLHHVAFAEGPDTSALHAFTTLLGLPIAHTEVAAGFVERMLPLGGTCWLQALEASGPGVVAKFLSRRGPGLHHIALEVEDVATEVERLRWRGAELIDDEPRRGGNGSLIAFLHPRSFGGVLVELIQDP